MPHPKRFDVVIVGAGPAGALTGYYLARRGLSVAIIEKKATPRYKACGGGLTRRTLEILPFDISPVVEKYPTGAKILIANRPVFEARFSEPLLAMVMRDQFDHYLTQKAVAAGAALHDQTRFDSLSGAPGTVNVETSRGSFKARIVIGADGVSSRVAKALGLRVVKKAMTAIEGEVYAQKAQRLIGFENTAHFDFGVIPQGYGWVFPKQNHLSIGVVSRVSKISGLKDHFAAYLRLKHLDLHTETRTLKGHLIPYAPQHPQGFANCKGLLVGDAAGFSDPITGEGIYYAVRGAQIASQAVVQALIHGYDHLAKYSSALVREFGRELRWARGMGYMIHQFPGLSHRLLRRHGSSLGQYHLDIMTGRRRYAELPLKVFKLIGSLMLRR